MFFISRLKKFPIANHIILSILALTIILPITILLFNSVKPKAEIGINPLGFPNEIRLRNYSDAFVKANYAKVFFNSFVLVVGTLFLCIPLSGAAAFSLAVMKSGKRLTAVVGLYLLVGLSIPASFHSLEVLTFE